MRTLLFFAALIALIGFFIFQFPHAIKTSDDSFHLIYLSILAVLIGTNVLAAHKMNLSRDIKHALWWVAIILALVFGYSFRHEISQSRLAAELIPSRAQTIGGATVLRRAAGGHFYADVDINGTRIAFMVDTGASDVVLSPDDARRLGFNPDSLAYTRGYHTANGMVVGAPVVLEEVRLGSIIMTKVEASVNKAPMQGSLLGMTFFNRLQSYRVEGDTLTLQP